MPEREGWLDRDKLYDFSGRGRKPQIALAEKYGITDYAQPAGGCCFLTDESYSKKLADLWQTRGSREYELDDIMLLKVGRHLRPRSHFKLIISREEGETKFLEGYRKSFTHLRTLSHGGPLALVDGDTQTDDLLLAARLLARYSQGREADHVDVSIHHQTGEIEQISVTPFKQNEIPQDWYI